MKTVVGLYSTVAQANQVKAALESEGFDADSIKVIDQTSSKGAAGNSADVPFTEKVKDFFSGFSEHNDEHTEYAKSINGGGALLSVTVPDEEADETADLLAEHGATGIQDNSGAEDVAVLESGRQGYVAGQIAGEQVIPVVQEDLVVGKRQVQRGGVRIYSHLVEQPVSADVTLRNERVVVDRRPVDREATDADFNTGNGVLELTATGEEAVVGKSSRVVEEIRVGKEASEHTEQINDTVRHTEVEVEPTTVTTTKDRY